MKSRFETHLPLFEEHRVGCYCWGLVTGKIQTQYGWESRKGSPEPRVWHHDLLRKDGEPFDPREIEIMRAQRGL